MTVLRKFEDTIILGSGHALIMPHVPTGLQIAQVENHMQQADYDLSRCGLFDTGSPNYATYYPEVTAEDFIIKEGDLFRPLVRALSQVIVHKNWNPVDFSQGNVLKESTSLLYGQTIFIDHETATGTALGSVSETSWQDSYKAKGGILVPAGMNARLQIDGKSSPGIVRKMSMDPPAIHSVSVTVRFAYEPSHKDIPVEEFYRKLGTYDSKGNMYTRVATRVQSYSEISLVAHGADPFAQIIKDGQITNPKYADVVYNSADGKPAGIKYHFMDFKDALLQNSDRQTIPPTIINNDIPTTTLMKRETLLLLAAAHGISAEGKDDATLMAELEPKMAGLISLSQAAADNATKAADLQTKLTEAQTALSTSQAKVTELENAAKTTENPMTAYGTTALNADRAEAVKLLGLLHNGQAPADMVAMLNNGSPEIVKILLTQYRLDADTKLPLSCKACGSKEVSRGSSKPEEVANVDSEGNTITPKGKGSFDNLRDRHLQTQLNQVDRMHGTAGTAHKA